MEDNLVKLQNAKAFSKIFTKDDHSEMKEMLTRLSIAKDKFSEYSDQELSLMLAYAAGIEKQHSQLQTFAVSMTLLVSFVGFVFKLFEGNEVAYLIYLIFVGLGSISIIKKLAKSVGLITAVPILRTLVEQILDGREKNKDVSETLDASK